MKNTVESDLKAMRHSCSHVLAQAVLDMFPEAKLAIGPAIDNGFYYDFDLPRTLIPEDLPILEEKMKEISKEKQLFEKQEKPVNEAIEFLKQIKQAFKVEMAEDLKANKEEFLGFYENKDQNGKIKFVDMCAGPHVEDTSKIGAFKLTHIAGAYFKGNEKNKMLQRIYGLCFPNEKELRIYLNQMEEAKKRDHRELGKRLELFTFDEEVGPGLPLWMPNGTVIADAIEDLAKEMELKQDYKRVKTPHIAKGDLYKRSGHLPYYADSMFPPMEMDGTTYYLKAMNCPHHHKIYAATPKSYRDLPLRLAEYGCCYRYEDSGALYGLMRVRSLCMNDAHIYCTEEQFEEEFIKVIDLYKFYFKVFNVDKFEMRLSKHGKEGLGKKYVDNEKLWIKTEEQVRNALEKSGIPFVEAEDEAAFYGPKIDVQIWSVIGREFTLATNQLDFAVPERFNLTYTDKDGKEKTPICIHRAPLSTHERLIGFLIEHFGGAFPTWLAPVQVKLISVADDFLKTAMEMADKMKSAGIRVEVDDRSESVSKKIRDAELKKIPYMIVVGEKEKAGGNLSVRSFRTKEQESHSLDGFIKRVKVEIESREIG